MQSFFFVKQFACTTTTNPYKSPPKKASDSIYFKKNTAALTTCCFQMNIVPVEDSDDLLITRAQRIHSKDGKEEINLKTTKRIGDLLLFILICKQAVFDCLRALVFTANAIQERHYTQEITLASFL